MSTGVWGKFDWNLAYGVCSKKWHGDDKKMGQKYQNLGHLQTAISQARNKLLTNFQRLQSTTRHGHMVCVQKSDMGMTKKWCKSNKFFLFRDGLDLPSCYIYQWLPFSKLFYYLSIEKYFTIIILWI